MNRNIPSKIAIDDKWITVHLAGPGFGEAVLITIGQKIAIGIDCCFSLIEANQKGEPTYLETQIASLGNPSYMFWLISHFHADHIQSFDRVLDLFEDKLDNIIVPPDYTERDLIANEIYVDAKQTMKKSILAEVAKTQYEGIRDAISRESLENKVESTGTKHTWLKSILQLPDGKTEVELQVDLYGLTHRESRALQGKAVKGIKQNRKTASLANEGSYILHIRAGAFEGLFLGDGHIRRTAKILNQIKPNDASIIYLKVAHHGSTTGTSQLLLDKITETTTKIAERYALIAPFDLNGLPVSRIERMITNAGFQIRKSGSGPHSESLSGRISRQCDPIVPARVDRASVAASDIIVERIELRP